MLINRPCGGEDRNPFQRKAGQVVLDQIRTVDQARLVKRLGQLDAIASETVLDALAGLFEK